MSASLPASHLSFTIFFPNFESIFLSRIFENYELDCFFRAVFDFEAGSANESALIINLPSSNRKKKWVSLWATDLMQFTVEIFRVSHFSEFFVHFFDVLIPHHRCH